MILITIFGLILVVLSQENVRTKTYDLQTFTSQEKELDFNSYQSPYQIDVKRISSTTPHELNHCRGFPRKLNFNDNKEVFRLDISSEKRSYDDSMYLSITSLDSEEEIVEFQNLGNKYFVVTNNNKVLFLKESVDGKLEKQSETFLPNQARNYVRDRLFFVLVIDFAPLLIFPHMAVLCSNGVCKAIQGWQPIQHITHANFMKLGEKRLIVLSQDQLGISTYQLTHQFKLENHLIYGKQFFNSTKVQIFDVAPDVKGNRLMVLDYSSGLYSFNFNSSNQVGSVSKLLDQRNCFSMDFKSTNYIVMNCRVGKSDFLLQVYQDNSTGNYIPQRPIFKYQTILDVILTEKFYASRGFFGLKFYWVNPKYPYPLQFKKAGQLFIHNAIQIRYKNHQNNDYLFYATSSSIHRISIKQKPSYATCISKVPTQQTFSIQYKTPCQNKPQSTCTIKQIIHYEVWKHQGISIMKTLVPTLLTFIGVIVIIALVILLYKKYQKQEDEVSLRFSSTHEFEMESAR